MRRFLSIWLPAWEIERLSRQCPGAVPRDTPLALVDKGPHGIRIRAVNASALREGVRVDVSLSDARAAVPGLLTLPLQPETDLIAVRRLARWCGRYGPCRNAIVVRSGSGAVIDFGIWADIAGVGHLYGGEAGLLDDLRLRLERAGFTARMGVADSFGAAHALARFGAHEGAAAIAPGETRRVLADLPVEGLRLDPETVRLLRRLGLCNIGQLYGLPRTSLARRFREAQRLRGDKAAAARAQAILMRLDQALGILAEPLRPLAEPPVLGVRRTFPDILVTAGAVRGEVESLMAEFCRGLKDAELGVRRLRLLLARADGSVAHIYAGTSIACRTPAHLMRLMSDRLDSVDAGFGIDAIVLDALRVERSADGQGDLTEATIRARERPEMLIDRLTNRSSAIRVFGLDPRASHIPERAEARGAPQCGNPHTGDAYARWPDAPWTRGSRPALLLGRPEPIAVMAEVPEGAPKRFVWRRVGHRVVKAEGPERLLPEWWRHLDAARAGAEAGGVSVRPPAPRDYYRIEVEGGARYWVFRLGLYGGDATEQPRWFMHGLFG